MSEDILNMDGSQLWDIYIGSQTVEEFMNYSPNQTIEEAVEEYVSNANFEFMFLYDFEGFSEVEIKNIRTKFIDYINTMSK